MNVLLRSQFVVTLADSKLIEGPMNVTVSKFKVPGWFKWMVHCGPSIKTVEKQSEHKDLTPS